METTSPAASKSRQDPHRCTCGARFEVAYDGDPLDDPVTVEVACPRCGKAHHGLTVPRAARGHLVVECVPGPEPENGGGD
jgi:hypothetical protein